EHSGNPQDEWPEVQLDAYHRGVAAILKQIGARENMCCGHKEYALPKGRKSDPTFDMPQFRSAVGAWLDGRSPPPMVADKDDKDRPTLRRGAKGEVVAELQRLLELPTDGSFGSLTEAALRAKQRELKLVPDG